MSYLTHLKRNKHHHSSRWIVKFDENDLVREVKLIYSPEEYRESKKPRTLNTLRAGNKEGSSPEQDIQKAINVLHFELDRLYKKSETRTGQLAE